jgi:hypothetical protein
LKKIPKEEEDIGRVLSLAQLKKKSKYVSNIVRH